jgi:hypothetical protein
MAEQDAEGVTELTQCSITNQHKTAPQDSPFFWQWLPTSGLCYFQQALVGSCNLLELCLCCSLLLRCCQHPLVRM